MLGLHNCFGNVQQPKQLYMSGLQRKTLWVYMAYGPGSAPILTKKKKKVSEKGPLNLHALVFRRNTQVGSRAQNVGKTTEIGKIPASETGPNNTSEDLKLQ